jgi:hypothetical protein
MSLYFQLACSVLLAALRDAVKNPAKREQIRRIVYEIDKQIHATFPDFID